MMRKANSLAAMILCACFSVPHTQGQSASQHEEMVPAARRQPAPDFTVADIDGRPITLSKYKGRVVLLDFWAIACGGCKQELPWYVGFDSRYRSAGLSLIGLDMYGDSPAAIKPFMKEQKMKYAVADGTDELGSRFGLKALPLTLLIDRKGRIAVSHEGIVEKDAFEKDLRQLLAE